MPTGRVNIAFNDTAIAPTPTWTRIDNTESLVAAIEIKRGRQSEFDHTETSTATVYLKDRDGLFDPDNVSSPYYGLVDGAQISLSLYNPVEAEWVEQYRGLIDDQTFDIDPSGIVSNLQLQCVDAFDYLAGVEMLPGTFGTTPPSGSEGTVFYEDGPVDDRIIALLADSLWPSARSVVFTGNVTVMETKYDPGDSVLVALRDAADAEFPGIANLYTDKQGRVVFHGRQARFDPDGVSAGAGPTAWTFTRWGAGDGAAILLDPTRAQIRPPLTLSRPRSRIINAAIAYPRGMDETSMSGQITLDTGSRDQWGYRAWSAPDLLTLEGTTTALTGVEETKLFADFMVANYSVPRTRVESLTFKALRPDDGRASATWALLCGADISDIVNLEVGYPGGAGISEDFYIEGSAMRISPLNPAHDMVELTLNVSPVAYYGDNVGLV